MQNKDILQLNQLKLKCDETFCKASKIDKESEIGFYCGWLSAICLVYSKHDKKYFKSLSDKIALLLHERRML